MERVCRYRALYEHAAVGMLPIGGWMIGEFFLNLSKARLFILVRAAQDPLFHVIVEPQHPCTLGAGCRGASQQG